MLTHLSLGVIWAHDNRFRYRGGESTVEKIDKIALLEITDNMIDPVEDLGVSYRGQPSLGTVRWWNEYNNVYEAYVPVPSRDF